MKLEILVSAVNEDVDTLAERMNLQADAIIVNQCGENTYREYTYQEDVYKRQAPTAWRSCIPIGLR